MALLTANGVPVVRATIIRPRIGVWHADLEVDAADAAGFAGPVELSLYDGAIVLSGTARRSGQTRNTVYVRVVGGADGLGGELPARGYQNVPLRIPLADVLSAAGETLSPASDAGVLATSLAFWARGQMSAGKALTALLAAAGAPSWRILADGTLWVGPETWPAARLQGYDLLREDPHLGRWEIGCDVPLVEPGQVLDGHRVSSVEIRVTPDKVRILLLLEDSTEADRMKAGLAAFVKAQFPRLDFYASYRARIVSQNGDGSLEVVPDDQRIPPLSRVPIRLGIPGAKVTVAAGARVLLGFAGGDPAQPQAELWEYGSVTELDLTATNIILNGGTAAVGRVGDAVAVATTMATWITKVSSVLNTPGPVTGAAGTVTPPTDFGTINAGAPGVKA